jgi:epoxyqueuosine reductase
VTIREELAAWAGERGYRWGAAPVGLVDEVRRSFERRLAAGEIGEVFYRENLGSLTWLEKPSLADPVSIVLVAAPRPAHTLVFVHGGERIEAVLPPTYVRYRKFFADVREDLERSVPRLRGRLELLEAPLKTLGNRMGLLCHGRNNIGYVEGMGSFFQLVGLVSEVSLHAPDEGPRPEEALLLRCEKCRICAAACPTGAIGRDRFLLHGEKCYTLFSESLAPMPEGLRPPSPRCLIGCLRCQDVCPEDKGRLKYESTGIAFSEEETGLVLDLAEGRERGLARISAKLGVLGLSNDARVYARNLKIFLACRVRPS